MSGSTAIGMVSQSLRNLLIAKMAVDPPVEVTILAPDESGSARRINLFLYKIQENPTLRNIDWQVNPEDPTQLVSPPLALNLFYLMTPYAPNEAQTGNATAHQILGDAMRVFYNFPIVPRDVLDEGLIDEREQIKIMLNTMDGEELSRVWHTFTKPYRLSALYEVSVVQIDPSTTGRPVPKRVERIGVPQVRAPFNPPVVERIEPFKGPAASVVTFHGRDLAGWQTKVQIAGRAVPTLEALTGDQFTVVLPEELLPGFHEIRVDISHLFYRTFFFEVSAT